MEQIPLTSGLPQKSVAAIMMSYKNTKVKVCSSDRNTDYFDIVAGVLQGDIFASYLVIICLDHVLRTSRDLIKENGFKLTKEKSRGYLAQTITNVDYADGIALLGNTSTQAETRLHSLELVAGFRHDGIHVVWSKR